MSLKEIKDNVLVDINKMNDKIKIKNKNLKKSIN
jgi:hypothetical protein